MKFPLYIKQRLARTRAAIYRSIISWGKRVWNSRIKPWRLAILSSGKAVFEFLRATFVGISLVLASILFIAILWRISDGSEVNWIDDWLGTSHLEEKARLETIKTLGQGLGVIIGIYVVYRRARASDKIAQAQQKTAQAQHNANEQKMFNDATAKLSDKSASVRLGGIYALDTLARSNEAYLVRIVKILCAHLRETAKQSKDEEDKKKDGEAGEKKYAEQYKDKPSNEIQSLLEVLSELNRFSEEKQSNPVRLNLSDAYLVGVNLENACLNRADLSRVNMRQAHLFEAQMQGAILTMAIMMDANLEEAQMQSAILTRAWMPRAILIEAQMQRAVLTEAWMLSVNLSRAEMQEANLQSARMQRAILAEAWMQGAKLEDARMQRAELEDANMQGTVLEDAKLQGAYLSRARMQGAVLKDAKMQGAELDDAKLQGANLSGVKMQGAYVARMQVQGVELSGVDLRGAYCRNPYVLGNLQKRIKERIDKPADVDTVIFSGGLKQEDVQCTREQLTECQENGWMTQEEVERIIAILEEHQGKQASNKPPSDIETGSYDENEAEAIIDKYKEAMAEVELWG